MDLRLEKTKNSIINTFLELRSKKELEKITVKELCEKAQINKSTFYSHYHDLYDLSEQLEDELVSSIIMGLQHPESVIVDSESFTRELFREFLAKDNLVRILFSGSRRSLLIRKIDQSLRNLMFTVCPEVQDNPERMITLTYTIYGGYYAFYENRMYGDETVVEIIAKLSTTRAC